MIISKQLFQNNYVFPENFEKINSHILMEKLGFSELVYSGFPMFGPIGRRIINYVSDVIKQEAEKGGFSEIYLPLVQQKKYLEKSGRADIFGDEFMQLSDSLSDYILTPTNEEVFLNLAGKGIQSYRQLPIKLFQIADKFRNVQSPKGIMRTKQFLMCDMCSIDETEKSLKNSADEFEKVVDRVFERFGIDAYKIVKDNGNYVDYLITCPEGETKIKLVNGKAFYSNEEGYEKSSSVAMYFIYDLIDNFKIKYNAKDNVSDTYFLGTYGFGIQRCLHAIIEQNRNKTGIDFPKDVRPFDVYIIPLDAEDDSQKNKSLELYNNLLENNIRTALDDRIISFKDRAKFSELLGTPYKIFIGKKEVDEGFFTLKEKNDYKGKKVNEFELSDILKDVKSF